MIIYDKIYKPNESIDKFSAEKNINEVLRNVGGAKDHRVLPLSNLI